MKITVYLAEIRPALEIVIPEIFREHRVLAALRSELEPLVTATNCGYERTQFLAINSDLDDEGLGTANYWDTYFGPDKERYHKCEELDLTKDRIAAHEFSVSALSGNLLQYGRQGISLRFGKKRVGCPEGRLIAGISLHELIWQARNQALHWEEGTFHDPATECFERLAANLDVIFAQYKNRSMAFEIVQCLGWLTVEDFELDMMLLNV